MDDWGWLWLRECYKQNAPTTFALICFSLPFSHAFFVLLQNLGGERYSYTGQSVEDILRNSSRLIYNIDEGVTLGPIDRHLLLGGVTPPIGSYNYTNPLEEVKVLQNLYGALLPADIVNRLKNCNRPGGPVELTEEEAGDLLEIWKEAMENSWTRGWDDKNDGPVQFVAFFDDGGSTIGSTGRMLTEITLDNTTLTTISIVIIAFFSALFLFSFDFVESRVLITLFGVALVVLSFFSALGFGLLVGVKINVVRTLCRLKSDLALCCLSRSLLSFQPRLLLGPFHL